LVHLSFNVIGTIVWLSVFCLVKGILSPALLTRSASLMGIAVAHSIFNILCTILMLPMAGLLEKLVCRLIPDSQTPDKAKELDERLLGSPALALARCRSVLDKMAQTANQALRESMAQVLHYDTAAADRIRTAEDETDRLEDLISTYLLKLTSRRLGEEESVKATEYLKLVGDYERIADHAVNILESAEEMRDKEITFTEQARGEYRKLTAAVEEILGLSYRAFSKDDYAAARQTEPLEQLIDQVKEELRTRHLIRLQRGECTVAAGFIWSDLLSNLERVSDHCSNVSGGVLDTLSHTMNIHENQRLFRSNDEEFTENYRMFEKKYSV